MGRHFAWGHEPGILRLGEPDQRFLRPLVVFAPVLLLLLAIPLGMLSPQTVNPGVPPPKSTSPQSTISNSAVKERTVKRISTARPSPEDIVFHSFEFQTIYFGREGPNYKSLRAEPSKTAQQLAKAEIFGQPAIASITFKLIDENENDLEILHFIKTSHIASDGEFFGLVIVPKVPFRVKVRGNDIDGNPFERSFGHLFHPRDQPPTAPQLPLGAPLDSAKVLKSLEAEDARTKARYAKEAESNPEGVIIIPRIQVLSVNYCSFLSATGNPLGIQIQYEARFSQNGAYSPSPFIFPKYEDYDLRGVVEMKVIHEKIEPAPEVQYSFQLPDLLKFDTAATYSAGVTYHFTVDLIPDYVIQNAAKDKFCIYVKKFAGSQKMQANWDKLRSNGTLLKYGVEIHNSDFKGETDAFFSQKNFLASFVAEGAQDCGPNPNVNF